MSTIRITSVHEALYINCLEVVRILRTETTLPRWIVLAVARHLFSENLAERIVQNMITANFFQSRGDSIELITLPVTTSSQPDDVLPMPHKWLERIEKAYRSGRVLEIITDQRIAEDDVFIKKAAEIKKQNRVPSKRTPSPRQTTFKE